MSQHTNPYITRQSVRDFLAENIREARQWRDGQIGWNRKQFHAALGLRILAYRWMARSLNQRFHELAEREGYC